MVATKISYKQCLSPIKSGFVQDQTEVMAINMCSSSSHSHTIYLSSLQSKFPLKTNHSLSSSPSKLCFNISDSNVVLVSETMPYSSPDIKLLENKLWEKELERDWKEGVGVRRKKRRKRRSCEVDKEGCGEIKQIFSMSKTKRAGQHLSSKEEAEYIFFIKVDFLYLCAYEYVSVSVCVFALHL